MQTNRFLSLRWRVMLFAVVLTLAMTGVYFIALRWSGSTSLPQEKIWSEHVRAVDARSQSMFVQQQTRVREIASLAQALQLNDSLQPRLESAASESEHIVVTDLDEVESPIAQAAIENGSSAGFEETSDGLVLYIAMRILDREGEPAGVAMVGQDGATILNALYDGGVSDLALFDANGTLIQTTFPSNNVIFNPPREIGVLDISDIQPQQTLKIGEALYQVAYVPLNFGETSIGSVGVLLPDTMPFAAETGRQLSGLALATAAAAFVITLFVILDRILRRVRRVTQTAERLAAGDSFARTGMRGGDEIGVLGQALDRYAEVVAKRQDVLRADLRRQRREVEHLQAVIESMPDGVLVQDANGRVIMMNENARRLLGSQHGSGNVEELTAHVTDKLGPALAPGLYSLGSPQQVDINDRMLSAQAAAVTNLVGIRLGTVVMLRDITEEVKRERAREKLLQELETNVQQPLAGIANPAKNMLITDFAREITKHAVALQKTVIELREMSDPNVRAMPEPTQHPILLDTLVWSVANEWRQVAQANNLTLHVMIEKSGLYVLGNERRLRWAIGNVIDNSIKYTPPGGALTLEIRDDVSEGRAHLRVRDNGVGISPTELPNVFTRFYRGNPVTNGGRTLRVPGTGQGLSTAKQIFESHGGSISIKSRPGVGTAVYLTIPLTAPVGLELPGNVDLEGETVRITPTNAN
jgi:signal transduction histidine kinase